MNEIQNNPCSCFHWLSYNIFIVQCSSIYNYAEMVHATNFVFFELQPLLYIPPIHTCARVQRWSTVPDFVFKVKPGTEAYERDMNLEKVSKEEKLNLSRKYFYIGLACAPFVWLANAVWFFREAFFKEDPPKGLRRYVLMSMVGTLIWTVVFVLWTIVYQTQRAKWGAFGDYISFWAPKGIP